MHAEVNSFICVYAIKLNKKQLYYLDPYGPSCGVCSVYAALVFRLDFSMANLLT